MQAWCVQRGRTVGAVLSVMQGWSLAQAWFSDPRQRGWQRRPITVLAQLAKHIGLRGSFWALPDSGIG